VTVAKKAAGKKGRSPAYPGVDLETALDLARKLYDKEHRHSAAPETVFQHWKLPANSSYGLVALSALKKFGLFDTFPQRGDQSGHVRLSDTALNILLDSREDASERAETIRQVALKPSIHAELWRKYSGNLPSDPNLRFHLTRERGFTERGADEFIGEFRRTIAFAGLDPSHMLSAESGDKMEGDEAPMSTPQTETDRGHLPPAGGRPPGTTTREVPIPISGEVWPTLKAAFPLSEDAWQQMIDVLTAMKAGLVASKKDASGGHE